MPLQWSIWNLENPPSGVDGRKWSVSWFKPTAINAWARRHPEVAAAIRRLEAIEGCLRVEVEPRAHDGQHLELLVLASLERSEVYEVPIEKIRIESGDPLERHLWHLIAIAGPEAPIDSELPRADTTDCASSSEVRLDQLSHTLEPLLTIEVIRRLGSQDLKNTNGVPLRPRLLESIRGQVEYRIPRQVGRALTDMSSAELVQVVRESEDLVEAFRDAPDGFWPLLPNEVERIRRPPPVRRRPSDYEDRLDDPEDAALLRSAAVLGRDLVLMRLGYDPDDKRVRSSLNTELSRGG